MLLLILLPTGYNYDNTVILWSNVCGKRARLPINRRESSTIPWLRVGGSIGVNKA